MAGVGQEHRYCHHAPFSRTWTLPSQPPAGAGEVPGADTCVICRLGRWWRAKEAKNSICIIPLKRGAGAPSSGAADRAWPRELQELVH